MSAPLRRPTLPIAALVAAAAAFAPQPAAAAKAVSTAARCDDVAGPTVGASARWRIVAMPRKGALAQLVACAQGEASRGRLHVRVLGQASLQPGVGIDAVDALCGDLAVVTDTTAFGDTTTVAFTAVDLRTGAAKLLGQRSRQSGAEVDRFVGVLTADRTVISMGWHSFSAQESLGFNGATLTTLGKGTPVVDPPTHPVGIAPSLGDGTTVTGAYVRSSPANGRAASRGAARTAGWEHPARFALRWRKLAKAQTGGTTQRTQLAPAGAGHALVEVATHGRTASTQTTWLELRPAPEAQGTFVAEFPLAPGSAKEAKVLSVNGHGALVAARFADAPDERRLRWLRADTDAVAVDQRSSPELELPGHAVLAYDDHVALAANGTVTVTDWNGSLTLHDLPGAHDLAFDTSGFTMNGLFATDAGGQAYFWFV